MSRINTLLQRIKNAYPSVNLDCFYTGGGLDYVGLTTSSLDLIIASSPYDDDNIPTSLSEQIPTSLSEQCCIITFAADEWTEQKSVRWFYSVHDAVKYLSTLSAEE